jgi:corrinoid protein of di/trimethylamine methyltransferase
VSKEEILSRLSKAVVDGDEDLADEAAKDAVITELDASEAIIDGLAHGMAIVGDYFEKQQYFLTEVVVASLAFKAGVAVLKPHIKTVLADGTAAVVIGTVQGDTHDIGKNIVGIMLEAAGFEVHDAGRDVSPESFVEKVRETKALVLGLSALMTSSMVSMKKVIELLVKEGLRDKVKIIIGGAPVSARYAREIGADAYSHDAVDAVRVVKQLLDIKDAIAGSAVA